MDPATRARHAALKKDLAQAAFEYHTGIESSLTDAEYDAKLRELAKLESAHPELAQDSLTLKVGARSSSAGPKVKHQRKMLSLDNVFTPAEANDFFSSPEPKVWEPKIDGLAVSLTYAKGELVRATTRGDGVEGDDVTHNALVIPTIPRSIRGMLDVEVRGEVVIFKADFEQLVAGMIADGDEPFANPRNAAAGSLKLKDSAECQKRHLTFIAYQAFGLKDVRDHVGIIGSLQNLGFQTPNRWSQPLAPIVAVTQELIDAIDAERKTYPFETDGVVFKVNSLAAREELGEGTKSPKWAVAYKFAPEEGVSRLLEVRMPIGRTGVITPVAILSPVVLNGATVQRASLCNFDEIQRLQIAVGDDVVVVRAAEVIPKVIRVHAQREGRVPIAVPTQCPCCGTPVVKDEELVAVRCTNMACPEQVFQRLSHAVSKASLDWDGCGDSLLRDLIQQGKCGVLSDLFKLEDLSFMKPAAKAKFVKERIRVKGVPLWRKLHALGLEGIGKSFCQELAAKYGSLVKLVGDRAGVAAVVGPNRVEKMFKQLDFWADELGRLDELGFGWEDVQTDKRQTQATGKQFVITGAMTTGSREKVAEQIQQAGGIVKSSVSAKTDYLIVGEAPGGNKTAGAKKHGTKCITEDELYVIIDLDPNNFPDDPLANVKIEDL